MLPQIVASSTGQLNPSTGETEGCFTVYLCQWRGQPPVRRRYSEFELLRAHLLRTHPFAIVPPIPEKEAAATPAAAKGTMGGLPWSSLLGRPNPHQVQYRLRMLESFLCHAVQSFPADVGLEAFLTGGLDWVR